jgi:hypothetical protein
MSQKNSGGGNAVGFIAACAALITALVGLGDALGLFSYLKLTKQPDVSSPPITSASPTRVQPLKPPSAESPTKDPASCPSKMTFRDLEEFNGKNNLQAKDICDNQTIILTGYINSASVQECISQNDSNEPTKIRCLRVYHYSYYDNYYGSYTTFNATNEEEKQRLVDISKELYKHGNHSIRIQSTISFAKKENAQIIDYSNLKILDYQPLNNKLYIKIVEH